MYKATDYNAATVSAILNSVKAQSSDLVESETIEFKEYQSEKALNNDSDLQGEVSALANSNGGVIVVGVRDGSHITASNWPSQLVGFPAIPTQPNLERLKGRLQGALEIRLENIVFESKNYLAIFITKHRTSVVLTSSGKAYIREGRSSRPMTPEELEHAVKSLQNYDWSADFLIGATDDDFSEDDVKRAHEEFCLLRDLNPYLPVGTFLERIEAKKNGLITKGGLLFLGKASSIKKFIGDVEFRFSWKEGTSLKKNDVWSQNLWCSINRAKNHFQECVTQINIKFDGNYYEVPNLDPDAFHEAFLNAIAHRDYSVEGMISVEFSGSRLQISSPGRFYGGISPENIVFHEPRHRNKALARMLMDYKFVDRAGMGVLRMGVQSLKYGRSFPVFEEDKNSVRVSMEAEYIRPGIFMLTHQKKELHISDLMILNSLYEKGYLEIDNAVDLIKRTTRDKWQAIDKFLERWSPFVELCGTKDGIYIHVRDVAKGVFNVEKSLRIPQNSSKYIALFRYLSKHEVATNEDISGLLEYSHSSTTSKFLGEVCWIERSGKSVASRWSLIRKYQ